MIIKMLIFKALYRKKLMSVALPYFCSLIFFGFLAFYG